MRHLRTSASVGAVLLSTSYLLAMFDRTAGTVLLLVLATSFNAQIAEISAAATIFFWAYALMQIPAGVFVDILGPRRLAALGGLVTGAGAFGFAFAQSIEAAMHARGVMAAGCSVVFVSLLRYIRSNWAERRVATVSGRCILVGNLGAIASAAPLSFVLGLIDWRTLWAVFGLVSFVGATILWFVMTDAFEPQHPLRLLRNIGKQLRTVTSNPANHVGFLLLGGLLGTYYALASVWAMPLLTARGVNAGTAALQTSVLIGGHAIGACVLGWLGDRTSRRSTLTAACAGAAMCWILLATDADLDTTALGVVLFALGFCSGAFNLVYALVTDCNPIECTGVVTAYLTVGVFAGAGVAELISSHLYVPGDGALTTMLTPMVFGSLLSILLSLSLFRQVHRYQAT
jgi:MFS family permease